MKSRRALFLDRDGVICRMVKYHYGWDAAQKPEDVRLVKGISSLIRSASEKGLLIVEVSNQPGVAKGKMNQTTSDSIERRVHNLLLEQGAPIEHVYICPHHPKAVISELSVECNCRKPKPGLLIRAAEELRIDLTKSIFLGDKASDALAGSAVGSQTIIYLHEEDEVEKVDEAEKADADFKSKEIGEIRDAIREWLTR